MKVIIYLVIPIVLIATIYRVRLLLSRGSSHGLLSALGVFGTYINLVVCVISVFLLLASISPLCSVDGCEAGVQFYMLASIPAIVFYLLAEVFLFFGKGRRKTP